MLLYLAMYMVDMSVYGYNLQAHGTHFAIILRVLVPLCTYQKLIGKRIMDDPSPWRNVCKILSNNIVIRYYKKVEKK